jgi:adenylate cyclase
MAAPVLAGLNSWVTATAAVAVINQREKLRIQKQFRARVSPQLVDLLAENPKALSMGGVERETTILFGDLAGFTTISEQLGGPDVVKTLNLYMGAMTRELTAQNAYVNKFLGDGLLAFWSAFVPEPRQCELAIASAIACQRLVKEIGERPDRVGLPPITLDALGRPEWPVTDRRAPTRRELPPALPPALCRC